VIAREDDQQSAVPFSAGGELIFRSPRMGRVIGARLMRKGCTRCLVGQANRGGSIVAPAQGGIRLAQNSSPAEKGTADGLRESRRPTTRWVISITILPSICWKRHCPKGKR
jgi:hypothetical protein